MAKTNNIPADVFKSVVGEPTTPEMVEEALKTGLYDVVTVTHNETTTGIMNPVYEIGQIVAKYPDVIYLVDAVSSLGGAKIEVDKSNIDIKRNENYELEHYCIENKIFETNTFNEAFRFFLSINSLFI